MTRSVSKELILDAAEAIARESGAAHMTLDAVAARAGISKGGLMYNFPCKEVLLQEMIARMVESFDALRDQVRRELAPGGASELQVEIRLLSQLDQAGSWRTAPLLAILANQPELMEPFHDSLCHRFASMQLADASPPRSTILLLAALGLHLSALLSIPFLEEAQRRQIYAELLRLAEAAGDSPDALAPTSPEPPL